MRFRKAIMSLSVIIVICAICVVLYGAYSYVSGKRFDSLQSAQCSQWIDEKSVLLGEAGFHPYKVYLYENEDKYRTIMTQYSFPFWRMGGDSWANKTDDKIKLVGWCSWADGDKGITVVPIQCFDANVAYIEMGSGTDYERKDVIVGDVVVFAWNKGIMWNDLNAVAYSSDDKQLYELGYEIINSTVKADELRWLPID